MTKDQNELIEMYEADREAQIERINKDYDAKIAHIKKSGIKSDKETVGDNDVVKEKIEIGADDSIAQKIADTTDLTGLKKKRK